MIGAHELRQWHVELPRTRRNIMEFSPGFLRPPTVKLRHAGHRLKWSAKSISDKRLSVSDFADLDGVVDVRNHGHPLGIQQPDRAGEHSHVPFRFGVEGNYAFAGWRRQLQSIHLLRREVNTICKMSVRCRSRQFLRPFSQPNGNRFTAFVVHKEEPRPLREGGLFRSVEFCFANPQRLSQQRRHGFVVGQFVNHAVNFQIPAVLDSLPDRREEHHGFIRLQLRSKRDNRHAEPAE